MQLRVQDAGQQTPAAGTFGTIIIVYLKNNIFPPESDKPLPDGILAEGLDIDQVVRVHLLCDVQDELHHVLPVVAVFETPGHDVLGLVADNLGECDFVVLILCAVSWLSI